ncbi:hypothetical protein BH02_3506 [Burkholderia pseudomallei]|nr:hypothetical protein BH02_3506 [Burkholderia pseudomallei]
MSAGLFFVRARHERQRVAAAGRRRDAAVVSALPSRVRSHCGVARSGRRIEAAARTGLRANGVGIRHPASGIRLARFRRCAADCRLSRETLSRRLAALRPCVPIAARDGRRCRGEAQSQRSLGAIGTPSAPERDACGTTRHTLDSRNGPDAAIASPVRSGRTRIAGDRRDRRRIRLRKSDMREPLPRHRIRRKTASVPRPRFDSRKGGPCARPRARGPRNGEPRGERCGVAQTRDERVRAQRRRASRHAAPATAARGALRRITPAAGGFRRRAETPVRRTCTDVSYLRKRLSQFVGCTGFFLATM